jgi:hypothetical protein
MGLRGIPMRANTSSPNGALRRSFVTAAIPFPRNAGRSRPPNTFATWLLLTGIVLIPSSLAIHLSGDGFKFTPGRAAIALLFLPALSKLLRPGRHFLLSDILVFFTAAWMIGSRFQDDGLNASAVAEVIELMGGYVVARAYFFGRPALQDFMRAFKILTAIVIILASLEPFAGRNVVTAVTSTLFHTDVFGTQYRYGIVRAQSTIEDSELYGTLCCIAGALCLYLEPAGVRRFLWVSFCFFGCLLSISSGPIAAFGIVVATHLYDRVLKQFTWRWKAYGMAVGGFVAGVYLIASKPTSWLISHMTLDPQTGFFRLYVFDYMFEHIAIFPFKGWGFVPIGSDEFLSQVTVDSVWIVCALRFGIPMIVFLLLSNIATFFPTTPRLRGNKRDPQVDNAGTGFTFALVCFMGIGLTVHFWNAIWMLWAVCLGVRGAIKESQLHVANSHSVAAGTPRAPARFRSAPARTGHGDRQ